MIIATSLFVSCSSTQKQNCNSGTANRMGGEDAKNWAEQKPRISYGNQCEKNYTAIHFQAEYNQAFNQQMASQCTELAIHNAGIKEGQAENLNYPTLNKLHQCGLYGFNTNRLRKLYQNGFTKRFCSMKKAARSGQIHGQNLQDHKPQFFTAHCPSRLSYDISLAYDRGYQNGLASGCSLENITEKARKDAKAGANKVVELVKISKCPNVLEAGIVYNTSFRKMRRSIRAEKAAIQRAKELEQQAKMLEEKNRLIKKPISPISYVTY